MSETIVAAGHGHALQLPVGARLTVQQTSGQQVVDLIAFRAGDLAERLSPPHTIASLGRLWPRVGDRLLSNRRTPLLELAEDTVGRHDLTIAACDPWRYEYDYGAPGHRNCSDNFLAALRPQGLARHELPPPVNLFQHMRYHTDGSVEFCPSLARAGDHVTLRALVPLLVAVSACPMDLNPISGGRPSDVVLRVTP
jgi:uncharacterized protein YcgI (DUF1989 family)